jgi:hypothetical protein
MAPATRIEEGALGKRKYQDPGHIAAAQYDPTGTYSARDMQALNEVFSEVPPPVSPKEEQQTEQTRVNSGLADKYPLCPRPQSNARGKAQLDYARTLLAVMMEAAIQMEQ